MGSTKASEAILEVKSIKKHYSINEKGLKKNKAYVKALDGISFCINKGETFGLVGESGCGKTTIGKTIVGLEKPSFGDIFFNGENMLSLNKKDMKKIRNRIQMIFQDPYSSLDPHMTVEKLIEEPLIVHNIGNKFERKEKVKKIVNYVGILPEYINRYPHELSGGQRQRIGIARALIINPELVICDEPVSALDVSIQSQIINLLSDLQKEFNLTYLFITHDLVVVKHISDRIGVMYLGKLVEISESEELFANPIHPYTKALLSAIPASELETGNKRIILEGDIPSPINIPKGCRFHTRCPFKMDICETEEPLFKSINESHSCACHLIDKN